ncbi:hypothetical protein SKAU_G00084300 [Synaphobranchus kaupii]|uniref:Uncharacterized protein n=1 Tax=Synaphobranchus kaupii TaxID=118154 RepID=A0A9Q1J4S6_SYNKA|nr:hypothetical protein SKAU_G00084300 [Synaphobranchus kaupii]
MVSQFLLGWPARTGPLCTVECTSKCHGFKFGPVAGKVLCELALGRMPSYNLSPFKIQRFLSHSKAAL